jgi:hypothetical protein
MTTRRGAAIKTRAASYREGFMLSAEPIWVRPIAIAASVDVPVFQEPGL